MDANIGLSASSRVKACTECRQHKLRCDASKDSSAPCSRCRRRGLHCEVAATFRRKKRHTKKELQAEVDSLRQQVENQGGNDSATSAVRTSSLSAHGPNSSVGSAGLHSQKQYTLVTPSSLTHSRGAGSAGQDLSERTADSQGESSASTPAPTQPKGLRELDISSHAIDSCFRIFHHRFLPHVPIYEGRLRPNICHQQSEFLFWTIISIGARKYEEDPTILTLLAPHLTDLASKAILQRDNPLPTIQAMILLCSWPLPHDSLSKDFAPMLAGALLQHALNVGLHIYGIGQDFSRTKLKVDKVQIQNRARLWYICITVCQRTSCSHGIPPPVVPDTYSLDRLGKNAHTLLPPNIAFEKTLTNMSTDGIVQLERLGLATTMDRRAVMLNPLIDTILSQLLDLVPQCPGELGMLYLQAAQLQVLCFHLFVPRNQLEDLRLRRMYELACETIETAQRIDQNQGLSDCGTVFVMKYLTVAAFTILKISRCYISQSLDLERGRRAYFYVIHFCRDHSVQSGDTSSRAVGILTQLWASKQIFVRSDGSYDSLTLRCGSRLAMSVMFDCFWWWKSEFAGEKDPYEEKPSNDVAQYVQPPALTPSTSMSSPFGELTGLDIAFPESQWATAEDLLSLDWSQFQYDPMLPFPDASDDPNMYVGDPQLMANPPIFQV